MFYVLLSSFVSNLEVELSPYDYRLMPIGGNGCIVATSSVMQSGILQDAGEILSVELPFLVMKGLSQ